MLIDTHAHLDFPDFAGDLDAVLARAAAAGVTRIITIGTSVEGSQRAVALAEKHPQVFAVVGVHPNNAADAPPDFIQQLRELARHPRVVGLGETGLDYHRLPSTDRNRTALDVIGDATTADLETGIHAAAIQNQQSIVFEQQLDLAAELGLNVVIHERDAWADTLELLRPYSGRVRAVFHCFGKPPDALQQVLDLGHLVSFTGIVTFKNATLAQDSVRVVPADRFMVETDCPFLAPAPERGKRCEPAHTRATAEAIAVLRGATLEQIATQSTATADRFFRFTAARPGEA